MTPSPVTLTGIAVTLLTTRPPVPVRPLTPPPPSCASADVLTGPDPLRRGRGNCVECAGTGDNRGERSRGALFCDACGGSGDYHGPPRRIRGPDGVGVTLYGPVPAWLAECIKAGTPCPDPRT